MGSLPLSHLVETGAQAEFFLSSSHSLPTLSIPPLGLPAAPLSSKQRQPPPNPQPPEGLGPLFPSQGREMAGYSND